MLWPSNSTWMCAYPSAKAGTQELQRTPHLLGPRFRGGNRIGYFHTHDFNEPISHPLKFSEGNP